MLRRALGSLGRAVRPVVGSIWSAIVKGGRRQHGGGHLVEPLEQRQLLSTLTIPGDSSANSWYIRRNPADSDNVQIYEGQTPTGTPIHDIPRRSLDSLIINAGGGDDTLIVDFSGGVPIRDDILTFNAGDGGGDALRIIGHSTFTGAFAPGAFGSGTATVYRKDMSFTGVESASFCDLRSFWVVTDNPADTLTIDSPASGQTRIRDTNATPAITPVTFSGTNKAVLDTSAGNGTSHDEVVLENTGLTSSGWLTLIAGTSSATQNNTLAVTGGATNLHTGLGTGGEYLDVSVSNSAELNLVLTQYIASVSINDTARVNLPAGLFKVLVTDALSIGANATLDLNDNDLIVRDGDLSAITALLQRGYNATGTRWAGTGIASGTAAADANHYRALGVLRGVDTGQTSLDGQPVQSTDVLVKFTLAGDADLNGGVNTLDYARIDQGYLGQLSGWFNGDFNYNGTVNTLDYAIIDSSYMSSANRLKPPMTLTPGDSPDEGAEFTLALHAELTYVEWFEDEDENGNPILVPWECPYDAIGSWTVDWGDGNVESVAGNTSTGEVSPTHAFADAGTYAVRAWGKGTVAYHYVGSANVSVSEVAPALTVTGDDHAHEGEAYTLSLSATDPGADPGDDTITSWTIDWGDGTDPETYPGDIEAVEHTFYAASTGIQIIATDEDGTYEAQKAVGIVPAAPSNVTAVAVSTEEAMIAWDAPTMPADAFYIWVSTDGVEYPEFDYVAGSQTSYRFFSVTGGVFTFRVAATNWSYSSEATTAVDPGSGLTAEIPIDDSIVPPPMDLEVTGPAYTDEVPLAWEPSDSATGYIIEWSDDGLEWFAIDEVAGTSYTDPYPALGDQRYRVVAYRGNLDPVYSEPSEYEFVHPIAPPVAWYDDNGGPNDRGTLSPFTTVHDMPLTFTVLPNDIDYDGGMLSIVAYDAHSEHGGEVSLDEYGNFTYTPPPCWAGTDTFTYVINDGSADSAPAMVAIDVTNAAPVANSATIMYSDAHGWVYYDVIDEVQYPNNRKTGALSAEDEDEDELTFRIVDWPAHGTLQLDEQTGEFQFEVSPDFTGYDFFTFVANDGIIDSLPSKVVIVADLSLVIGNRSMPTTSPPGVYYSFYHQSFPPVYKRVLPGGFGVDVALGNESSSIAPKTGYDTYLAVYQYASTAELGLFQIESNAVNFNYRPFSYVVRPLNSTGWWSSSWGDEQGNYGAQLVYDVSATETQAFTAAQTGLFPTGWSGSLSLGQQATHGAVALGPDGSFTYTPDSQTGEPYLGWDFFSVIAREAGGFEQEQWVQLNVGLEPYFVPPPPQLVTDPVYVPPEPQSQWVPQPFDGTLAGLEAKLGTVRGLRNQVVVHLAELGQAWQTIHDDQDPLANFETNTNAAIAALDAAQSDYLTYQDAWLELHANSTSYEKTWRAYWDNFRHGTQYNDVLMGVRGLPRDIGGLRPNPEYMAKITRALDESGDAAGFQSNLAGTIFTVAKGTHYVLEKAEYTLGLFTGGTYTAASFTTKAGLTAIAKTVARNYVIGEIAEQALTPVMTVAVNLAAQAGVSATFVRAGVLALQATGAIRAAKARLNTTPRPFKWKLGGKKIKPSGIHFSEVRWTKVSEEAAEAVWTEFNKAGGRRSQFLQSLVADPKKVKAMKKMGLTDTDLTEMYYGRLPDGYQVHHKKPRAFGGGNADDNLMLIRSTPGDGNMHGELNDLQRQLTSDMTNPGQTRTIEFPMFEGKYFCNERGAL